MKYLQIVKQMEASGTVQPDHASSLRNEINEINEISPAREGVNSFISFISFASDASRGDESADVAVATLRHWYGMGALDALPTFIPGFDGELSRYTDRDDLIGMVRAILAAVPWSLTALERAEQFVAVLTPLIATPEVAT